MSIRWGWRKQGRCVWKKKEERREMRRKMSHGTEVLAVSLCPNGRSG